MRVVVVETDCIGFLLGSLGNSGTLALKIEDVLTSRVHLEVMIRNMGIKEN